MNTPTTADREQGSRFLPKFDDRGLLTAVIVDDQTQQVLMVGFMDQEAIDQTLKTKLAHFHSRSRGKLWQKGETSGNVLRVQEILVDCDQDALVIKCEASGPTCHTGVTSCLYRRLEGSQLTPIDT